MKTLLAAIMLFASTAMGDWGSEPTWKELQNDKNIEILWPYWRDIRVNDLCVEGNVFRTVRPVRYCAEQVVVKREACTQGEGEFCRVLRKGERAYPSETVRETYGCGDYNMTTRNFRISRTYSTLECVKWSPSRGEAGQECLEERTVTRQAPTTHMVPYFDKRQANGEHSNDWMYKKYTIGSCR